MTVQTTNVDNPTGDGFDFTAASQTYMIMGGVAVIAEATTGQGVGTSFAYDKFINYGTLVGYTFGIIDIAGQSAVIGPDSDNVFINEASGLITANTAIYIRSEGDSITNYGQIQGTNFGIDATVFAEKLAISNYGVIQSQDIAVDIQPNGTLTNAGTINGSNAALVLEGYYPTDNFAVVNSGLIESGSAGQGNAIQLNYDYSYSSVANVKLTNTGSIVGNVNLSNSYTAAVVNRGSIVGDLDLGGQIGQATSYDGRNGSISGTVYGGLGNAAIHLGGSGEAAAGGAGNDSIFGGGGNDTLSGGAGVNYLFGQGGADALDGTGGTTYADYGTSADYVVVNLLTGTGSHSDAQGDTYVNIHRVIGSNFDDTITADNAGDALTGGGGNDTLTGGAGDDMLYGGAGNDTLVGGAGSNYLDGGAGADVLIGTGGTSIAYYIDATAGVTVNLTTPALDTGDAAGDTFTNIHSVSGSNYADTIVGDNAGDILKGNAGDDIITGGTGNDTLFGGAGADTLTGGAGVNILDGGAGADKLIGTGGTSYASYSDATTGVTVNLLTPSANTGDAAGDTYTNIHAAAGSAYADTIVGDNVGDLLNGNAGADTITGGTGADTIYGGAGADTLTGGGGADKFSYAAASEGGDTITDFSAAQGDTIYVSHGGFGGGLAASGSPTAAEFVLGTAATSANGQFLWNSATSTLSWDPDGTGAAAAVKIATLTGVTTLTAANISLY